MRDRRPRLVLVTTRDIDDIRARLGLLQSALGDVLGAVEKLSTDVGDLAETTRAVLLARTVAREERVAAARDALPKLADPREK